MKSKSGKSLVAGLVGFICLWVLIPVGLYFVGYKFVGPHFGEVPALSTQAQKVESLITHEAEKHSPKPIAQTNPDTTDDEAAAIDPDKAPQIDIEVEPAKGRLRNVKGSNTATSTKTKKKKTPKTTPRSDSTPRDEASGDAAIPERSDPASGG